MQTKSSHEPLRQAAFQRVEHSDRLASRLVVIAAAVVSLAILKPWASTPPPGPLIAHGPLAAGGASPSASGPSGSASAHPDPLTATAGPLTTRDAPDVVDADHIRCFNSHDWLLATLERDGIQTIRTWTVVDPAASLIGMPAPATSPVHVGARVLVGLGLCPPTPSGVPPTVPLLGAWVVTPNGGLGQPLVDMPLVAAPFSGTALLYGHPKTYVGEDATWPSGRYVIEAPDPRLNPDRVVWLRIEIVSAGNNRG